MFHAVSELWPNLNPTSVSIDFEQAAIGAVSATFPNSSIHGCLFHLTKDMRKKLTDIGLMRRYNTEPEFALSDRMIVALSFVPIDGLDAAFEDLHV